jgi:hypothetical protein
MNTLDDLRTTLERRADGLHDTELVARPTAVRHRVRVVRRRRAVAAVVAAALVVVAGVSATSMLRSTPTEPQPVGRVVVGVDVPAGIDIFGFPYELATVAELTDETTHVDPADHDQALVLAASGLGEGSATLYSNGDPIARVRGDEQVSAPVAVFEAGIDLEVRLDRADDGARVGVAVYEATGELAPGVSNGDVVFREEVAGARLVAGAFSSPGQSSVDLDAEVSGDKVRLVFYCSASDDLWINVSIDGDGALGSTCGDTGVDAGAQTSATTPVDAGPHDVRVYLTRGSDGPEVAPAGGEVFGVGIYDPAASGRTIMGTDLDSHVEYGGRTWVLDQVLDATSSLDTMEGDRLLGLVGRGEQIRASWSSRLSIGEGSATESPDDTVTSIAGLLLAGDYYDVDIDGGEGRLLVYRPED